MNQNDTLKKHLASISGSPAGIAVFDLDGTLTTRDTFVAFLLTFGWKRRKFKSIAIMLCMIAWYLVKGMKDYRLKERLIGEFFNDVPLVSVQAHTDWFVKNWLPRHLHPVGFQLLEEHRRNGDRLILLSASPNIYVGEIAKAFDIAEVICTEIEHQCESWRGKIIGKNCKGVNKRLAIEKHLILDLISGKTYAYGDSTSDRYILRWADVGGLLQANQIKYISEITTKEL